MLGLEDFMTIHALVKRGVYRCDMAEQLGVHPKTVSRAVQRGGPPAPRRGRRGRLRDPYRSVIDGLLAEGVWNAVVIWRELQARGDPGEISLIRDDLRPKRALGPGTRATVRFETEPGRQLQNGLGRAADGDRGRAGHGACRGEHAELLPPLPFLGDGR
ncbi:MAG TPA: hypothetical protein VKI99_13610 [Candidatus Dormibacteraeota bacterium]|nr:hypothetical protein [Candidatus Dormibacteraeota bacterium]